MGFCASEVSRFEVLPSLADDSKQRAWFEQRTSGSGVVEDGASNLLDLHIFELQDLAAT